MKTVFITIFQGVEAKNLLRTNVLSELLKKPDLRIVFFVRTPGRARYYQREFRDPRLIYEAVDCQPSGPFDRLFSRLKFHLLKTKTTNLRRRMDLDEKGNYFSYFLGLSLNRILARRLWRKLFRWLDFHFISDKTFAPFFERYQPCAVFLAHLFDDAEIALLREAKKRKIPTLGFINSWDKLTARCGLRLLPDKLLVYNEIVKGEAMAHADMTRDKIEMVGIPQYDLYFSSHQPKPREEFMRKLGLAPKKRFILYTPMGETFSSSDWDIIDLLNRWCGDGVLPPDCGIFVRFQPNDLVDEARLSLRSWLRYDRPGTRFSVERGVDWDMSQEELRHLADTLYHSSLLVCYASSMSVDAAIFGKPVINIDFELKPGEPMSKSPTFYYQTDHYKKALLTGGIRLVKSREELVQWLRRYLQDPSLDRDGRERLVKEQCSLVDGKAGERIARAIFGVLQ